MMNKIWERRQSDEGFTLIELLIVIVILGILAAVVVFAVGGVASQGKKSACLADVKSVQTASEAYYAKNGAYAADMPALVTAKFLRGVPTATVASSGYLIGYTAADGGVTAAPACSTLT